MFVRLLANLFVKRINIPLRRSAFATRRCPPSKGSSRYPIEWSKRISDDDKPVCSSGFSGPFRPGRWCYRVVIG